MNFSLQDEDTEQGKQRALTHSIGLTLYIQQTLNSTWRKRVARSGAMLILVTRGAWCWRSCAPTRSWPPSTSWAGPPPGPRSSPPTPTSHTWSCYFWPFINTTFLPPGKHWAVRVRVPGHVPQRGRLAARHQPHGLQPADALAEEDREGWPLRHPDDQNRKCKQGKLSIGFGRLVVESIFVSDDGKLYQTKQWHWHLYRVLWRCRRGDWVWGSTNKDSGYNASHSVYLAQEGLSGLYRDPEQIDGHVRPVSDLSFKMDGQGYVQIQSLCTKKERIMFCQGLSSLTAILSFKQ